MLRNQQTLKAFRDATESAKVARPNTDSLEQFDIARLVEIPYLQSVYAETLRLRVANIILRNTPSKDVAINRWLVPRGSIVAAMSYITHRDSNVFRTGSPDDVHPLDTFWPARFLDYGRPDSEGTGSGQDSAVPRYPRFSLDGLAGAFIPYGGGTNTCPGRHFAKQEILATAAMLIWNFDFELGESKPDNDWRFFGTGTLGVVGKTPCRIRRRL